MTENALCIAAWLCCCFLSSEQLISRGGMMYEITFGVDSVFIDELLCDIGEFIWRYGTCGQM
jgi:hypothetical protein